MRLGERFQLWRNRLLLSDRFQRWASGFFLTRHVARAKARESFDLVAGFVYSQVLYACVELGVLDAVRDKPLTLDGLADRIGLPLEGATRLARAGAALGLLLSLRDGRYGLGERGASFLGNRSVLDMVRHHACLYADLIDPVALLKERRGDTRLARFWGYGRGDAAALNRDDINAYSQLMASTQSFIAREVLGAYSLRGHHQLMDVGGGEGAFLCAAGAVAPDLKLVLFDLPAVAARGEERLEQAGLGIRAQGLRRS